MIRCCLYVHGVALCAFNAYIKDEFPKNNIGYLGYNKNKFIIIFPLPKISENST